MQSNYTDKEILELLHKDSERAIEIIFKLYYSYLCKVVYKIIPDTNLVEDLAQEVFYELWRKKNNLRINTSLKAYLHRAAFNKALNYIRDQKIKFEEEEKANQIAGKVLGSPTLETKELQELINHSIDSLPERCRIVFVLSRSENLTYREIADKLGISIKTVENQISKALRHLRDALGDYLADS